MKKANEGFTVLLSGEVWENASNGTLAAKLRSTVVTTKVNISVATEDEEAFDKAALRIGRKVMESVRAGAVDLRAWRKK